MLSKPIKDFEDYLVFEDGTVQSLKFSKVKNRKLKLTKNGYYQVQLCRNGKRYYKSVSRLIAEAFIPNPEGKPEINHKDNNPLNNHIYNLEWNTRSENMKYAFDKGLKNHKGAKHPKSKLTESMVIIIRKLLSEKELTQTQISSIFNVKQGLISKINLKQRWSHST